jgi:hypothetical protein
MWAAQLCVMMITVRQFCGSAAAAMLALAAGHSWSSSAGLAAYAELLLCMTVWQHVQPRLSGPGMLRTSGWPGQLSI